MIAGVAAKDVCVPIPSFCACLFAELKGRHMGGEGTMVNKIVIRAFVMEIGK